MNSMTTNLDYSCPDHTQVPGACGQVQSDTCTSGMDYMEIAHRLWYIVISEQCCRSDTVCQSTCEHWLQFKEIKCCILIFMYFLIIVRNHEIDPVITLKTISHK